jgi:hypothetical protein
MRMPALRITPTCSIDVGPGFRRKVEGGDMRLTKRGRTVWIAMYEARHSDPQASVSELYAPGRRPVEEWERRGGGSAARAWLLPDDAAGSKRWTLTTISASASELALVSFTFEDEEGLRWALDAWNSLRFTAK